MEPDHQPGHVKQNPDTKASATKCGPGVTAGEWFVFHPDNGGYYTGADEVTDWPDMAVV